VHRWGVLTSASTTLVHGSDLGKRPPITSLAPAGGFKAASGALRGRLAKPGVGG